MSMMTTLHQKRRVKRQRLRVRLARILMGARCEHCHERDDDVLQFDHCRGGRKLYNISDMQKMDNHTFWVEVFKCQLLCANCHQRKTKREQRLYRHLPGGGGRR